MSPRERSRTVHRLPVATSLDDLRANITKDAAGARQSQRNGKETNGKRSVSKSLSLTVIFVTNIYDLYTRRNASTKIRARTRTRTKARIRTRTKTRRKAKMFQTLS